MAKDKKLKASKNKVVEDKIVTQSQSTSSTTEKKTKGSKKPEIQPPDDEKSHSPGENYEERDEEEREVDEDEEVDDDEEADEDEEVDDEKADEDEEVDDDEEADEDEEEDSDEEDDEDKKADHLSWPKSDDLELFKQIRKACPKGDTMRYTSRVNNLDWELVQFQDYSADQCRNRWLHIQAHLRHYRILSDLLEDALSWVDNPWYNFNKGAKNDQKHPEQPKKPLSSYMLFFIEQKDAVMEKRPNLGMVELSKVIGKMYNGLSEQKKTKYLAIAEKHKEAYEGKMRKFMDAHPDYVPPKSKSAKAVAPRPPTPFNLFSDEKMTQLPVEGMSPSEARDRCRHAYKKLKDKQKLKWIHRALEQEDEYNEQLAVFKIKNPDVALHSKRSNLLTKEEWRLKNKSDGKPELPPSSGYSLFVKDKLSKRKGEPKGKAIKEVGSLWKDLKEEERALYKHTCTKMNNTYNMKYASYIKTLTLEQQTAELIASRGQKRQRSAAGLKEQPIGKRAKSSAAVDASSEACSSYLESDNDEASGEITREIRPKTAYKKQRKVNGKTVQESKNEMPSTSKKSSASTSAKAAIVPRKAVKSTANALKSPERDSSSKKSAGNSDSKSLKLSPKSSRPASSVKSSKEPKTPVWAANQVLYNEAEPPKPPKDVAAYYVMTYHHSEAGPFYSTEIDLLWAKVSEKQKKKLMAEYEEIRNDYKQKFENFAQNLENDKLEAYRVFMKKRDQYDQDSEDGSDDGSTDEGDNSSIWCEIDEDISIKL